MALVVLRIAAGLYALAAALGLWAVLKPKDDANRRILLTLIGAVSVHAVAIVLRAVDVSLFPFASIHDGLSLFSFLAAILAVLVSSKGGVPQVGLIASPLLAVLVVIAAIVEPSTNVPESLRSAWLGVHIGLALMGDAAIAIAGVVSIVYLVQERRLRTKKRPKGKAHTGLQQLPALEVLDGVSARLIKWGFPLMTLGLLSGAFYGKHVWGVYWTWDPRNTVSLLAWVLYAVMLYARLMIGWRGRKAAMLTVLGVIAILLAFVGLGVAGIGVHGKDYVS